MQKLGLVSEGWDLSLEEITGLGTCLELLGHRGAWGMFGLIGFNQHIRKRFCEFPLNPPV